MEGASGAGCRINGTPAPSVLEHNEGSPSAPLFVSFTQVKEEPSKKKGSDEIGTRRGTMD